MSNFFKSKYKLLAFVGVSMLIITMLAVTYAQNLVEGEIPFFGKKKEEIIQEEPLEEIPVEPVAKPVDEEEPEDDIVQPVIFHVPATMRGGFLTPGIEFYTSSEQNEETIKDQIDAALQAAEEFTLNTVLINTIYEEQVIYSIPDSNTLDMDFDMMEYIVSQAKERDLYVYGVFDVSQYKNGSTPTTLSVNQGSSNSLLTSAKEFAEKYDLDGVLLDGYQTQTTQGSYQEYRHLGGAMGFDNYMRQTPKALLETATKGIRQGSPSTQVGILADAVWANSTQEEEGSKTLAGYTSFIDGNADTKGYVEEGLVDCVVVKAYGSLTDSQVPFGEVVGWWTEVAEKSDTSVYILQASSKVGSADVGWGGGDELVKQAVEIDTIRGVKGNAFDSLAKLMANPGNSTTQLMKYYREDMEPELILTKLEMTRPAQTTYTTTETQVVFTGATDPSEPVTINDVEIATDQSGYFTVTYELKAGQNAFTVVHKDKTITYMITRQINILTEMSPVGAIVTDGGMELRITATAYDGATVVASIGGASIPLAVDESVVDEADRNSSYKTYTGVYTSPAATESVQNLGAISVTASWNGESKSLTGATVSVNKKAKIEDGVPVVVTVDQAKTYPGNTLDNIPRADCYPLPQGAMDYAVGEEITYKNISYTLLASGQRVKSSDISTSSDYASGNVVNALSVDTKDGFTYLSLKTTQKVSYTFAYSSSGLNITLNNTSTVPEDTSLTKNPLFTSANWSGSTLQLPFVKNGGFMGYKGYYDGSGNLVFRFNNTPSSVGAARIAIDPGHGGKDVGALGFLADYPEKVLNLAIARALAAELESRGAGVLLLDTSGNMSLEGRVAQAESFGADIFISVHNNTAPSATAKGTEVYYFYPFSYPLAASASANVSSQLPTTNRGARQSYYHVTLSPQFASVLVECGFMTNKGEYEKLIRPKYHEQIAVGIADGISGAIATAYTGVSNAGSQNSGGNIEVEEKTPEENSGTLTLNQTNITLRQGSTATLKASGVTDTAHVSWETGNASVATVSANGKLTGVQQGTATVTATASDGQKASCVVTVVSQEEEVTPPGDIPVNEIYLSHSTLNLAVGKTHQLDVEIYPPDASNKKMTWTTDNSAIVSVSSSGLVTGNKQGIATITVITEEGKKKESCTVQVGSGGDEGNLAGAYEIAIKDPKTTMYTGTSQTLVVVNDQGKVIPNGMLQWESADRAVATVDRNGVVTARKTQGITTIHVFNKKDTLFDSVRITVTGERVEVTNIRLNKSEIMVEEGKTDNTLIASLTPSNATHGDVTWRISNTGIASVDDNGVITGKKAGNTTLIVRTRDEKIRANCTIIVVGKGKVVVEDVSLDIDKLEMSVGQSDYLEATVEPQSSPNQAVSWTSSQSAIVEVDNKGYITAKAAGKVTITVRSTSNPDKKDTCEITVY